MSEHKFSIIPGRATTDRRLTDSIYRTLSAMCMYANAKTGWCFPRQQIIADDVGKSRQTVNEHISLLVEWGYITKQEQFREDGSQTASAYQVLYDTPVSSLETTPPVSPRLDSNNDPSNDPSNTASDEKRPPTKPIVMPLDWQIAAGVENISMPDERDNQIRDAANLIATGMGSLTAGAYGLAYAFMRVRGIIIPMSQIKGQRKAIKSMLEMGVKAEHVAEATQTLMDNKMTVVDLFSVAKTAIALANPAPDEYKGALEGV
jgi:biotin operon repressor